MTDLKELKKEHFNTYIGSLDDAIKILDYANRMVQEDGGQEHSKIVKQITLAIKSQSTSIRLGRWIKRYADKRDILN